MAYGFRINDTIAAMSDGSASPSIDMSDIRPRGVRLDPYDGATITDSKIDYREFGKNARNFAIRCGTQIYNFHVFPDIDLVSVTYIKTGVREDQVVPVLDESKTMTIERARDYYNYLLKEKKYKPI